VLLALRRWVWASVRLTPLRHRHRWLQALPITRRDPAVRADPVIRVDPATRADLAHMARAHPVVRVDLDRPDLADLADTVRAPPVLTSTRTVRAGPVVLGTSTRTVLAAQAGPVDPGTSTRTVLAGPVDPAHGMGIPSVAISTGPRGVTDPHLGDPVSRPGRRGTDRSRRPAARGITAPSTTGATRKRPFGIPDSTSGASGSSGSGSRCKKATPHGARLATPGGGRRRWRDGPAVLRLQAVLPTGELTARGAPVPLSRAQEGVAVVVGRQVLRSGANESLGGEAHYAATDFADMDERSAAKLRVVRCNSAT
jgi:Protein of unknown function (DUF2563)